MRFNSKTFRKSALATLGAIWLTACQASSTDSIVPTPDLNWPALTEAQSASDEFNEDGLAKLDARIEQYVTDGDVAGIATLLVKDGEVIHYNDYGIINPDSMKPVDPNTVYRIYSMTKPVTGVAMMMLLEEGKFKLDDPVAKYIPEFENMQVFVNDTEETEPLKRQPTMRELMSHMGGFAYGLGVSDPANRAYAKAGVLASRDMQSLIDGIASVPLRYQPGETWEYSISVDIQGAIIERLSGQSLGEFFKSRIFDPLGMTDTGFYVPEDQYERFSDVFGFHPETKEFGHYRAPRVAFTKETLGFESGGGGLVSTMGDYARFLQMLSQDGEYNGQRLISKKSAKMMRTNILPDDAWINVYAHMTREYTRGIGFGLNFGVIHDAKTSPMPHGQGTYFWGGAAGTWFWVDPENDLFFIGMIQRFPQDGPQVDFRLTSAEYVYDALKTGGSNTSDAQ